MPQTECYVSASDMIDYSVSVKEDTIFSIYLRDDIQYLHCTGYSVSASDWIFNISVEQDNVA